MCPISSPALDYLFPDSSFQQNVQFLSRADVEYPPVAIKYFLIPIQVNQHYFTCIHLLSTVIHIKSGFFIKKSLQSLNCIVLQVNHLCG